MLCTVLWIEVSTKNGLLALKDCKIWKNRKRNRQRNTVLSNGTSSLRKNGRFQGFPLQAVLTRARMSSWQVRPTSCPYNLEPRVIFEWWRCTFLSRRFRPPPSLGTSLLLHLWISPLCWRLAKPNPQVRPFSPTANSDFRGRPSSPWDIAWPNAHSLPLLTCTSAELPRFSQSSRVPSHGCGISHIQQLISHWVLQMLPAQRGFQQL